MNVFQFILNVVIAILACALVSYAAKFVTLPLEELVVFALCIVVVVLTFKYNAAAQLGV